MAKKKRSFFKIFFTTIFVILLLAVLTVVGCGIYAHFKYDVNSIALISQIQEVNKPVDISELVTAGFTADDFENADAKVQNLSSQNVVKFKDKEVAAYIDQHIADYAINADVGGKSVNLKSYNFKLYQITFSPSESGIVDVQSVIEFDIESIKNKKLSSFPLSIFKGMFPNKVYLVVDFTIKQSDDGYEVFGKELKINGLDSAKSTNVLNAYKMLLKISNVNLCQEIGKVISDVITSDNGFYGTLKTAGAKNFVFENTENIMYFDTYTVDTSATKTITYNNTKGATNLNPSTIRITDNTITLKNLQLAGYIFEGWHDHTTDERVYVIDANNFKDYQIDAKWTIIKYTITLDLRGGTYDGSDTLNYDVETAVNLPTDIIKEVDSVSVEFLGWTGTGLTECTKIVNIPVGSTGDRSYVAHYDGQQIVTLCIDGVDFASVDIERGDTLDPLTFFNPSEYGMNGYSVDKWYTSSLMSEEYDFDIGIVDDTIIYGSWNYISDNISFYPYLSQFDNAQSSGNINITSRDMLVAYMDYVTFFNITNNNVELALSYGIAHNSSAMENEVKAAYNVFKGKLHFTSGSTGVGFAYSSNFVKFYVNEDNMVIVPTLEFTDADYVREGQEYALKLQATPTRSETFDDFNINKVTKTLNVTTSEQLVWALENGYRPVCAAGSASESVYNQAKVVLRTIINDDMNDITKLRAIYEWLIDNVNYDYEAYEKLSNNIIDSSQAKKYYSWYAEGVFEKGRVVCEGYAKALLIMAKIENIPTIFVTGNNHAWNKVYVNGAWYGIDATHGDSGSVLSDKGIEILTHTAFLFTDEYKQSKGYTVDNYKESKFKAETAFDYYDYVSYNYLSSEFDLLIDNAAELTLIYRKVKNYIESSSATSTYYIFEFCLTSVNVSNFSAWASIARTASGLVVQPSYITTTDSNGNFVYTLFVSVA